ncbi:hypothetical protein SDJN02_23518, partial [Cucurbita argyrosperma subsp. argyrosperma]
TGLNSVTHDGSARPVATNPVPTVSRQFPSNRRTRFVAHPTPGLAARATTADPTVFPTTSTTGGYRMCIKDLQGFVHEDFSVLMLYGSASFSDLN